MPRTGTTLLQRLISEDSNIHSPYLFEMEVPIPPMASEVNPLEDPRINSSGFAVDNLFSLTPSFLEKLDESHLWSTTEMEESFLNMHTHNGLSVMTPTREVWGSDTPWFQDTRYAHKVI